MKEESDEEEEEEDGEVEQKEDLDEDDEISGTELNWSNQEQEKVSKIYGLAGTLLPKVWVDEMEMQEYDAIVGISSNNANPQADIESDLDVLGIAGASDKRKSVRPTILLNPITNILDKRFESKEYLIATHKNTCFKEMEQGVAKLKLSIEARESSLKGLVKSHFSKFVNAKVTIDGIYILI